MCGVHSSHEQPFVLERFRVQVRHCSTADIEILCSFKQRAYIHFLALCTIQVFTQISLKQSIFVFFVNLRCVYFWLKMFDSEIKTFSLKCKWKYDPSKKNEFNHSPSSVTQRNLVRTLLDFSTSVKQLWSTSRGTPMNTGCSAVSIPSKQGDICRPLCGHRRLKHIVSGEGRVWDVVIATCDEPGAGTDASVYLKVRVFQLCTNV